MARATLPTSSIDGRTAAGFQRAAQAHITVDVDRADRGDVRGRPAVAASLEPGRCGAGTGWRAHAAGP
ncbi:hypothetical protein G6F22_022063 [Rhizopus arrhizus]|nr:hypothetical protein G6F22_022063 [Rhizopus arrhizus]KAG1239918.1 hypothetical protein G6F68_018170 [Rhizopus microsporus]KAG1335692.1 hypothetical protein G6F61_014990 [Rhizopus arrhizus]